MATRNRKKTWRHGSVAVSVSVLLIAAVILLNGIFGALADRYGWYVDMNPTLLYPATNAFYAYLDEYVIPEAQATGEDVRILFCEDAESLTATDVTALVLNTAHEVAERYPEQVCVDHLNIVENPKQARAYGVDDSTDVVVICGDRTKVCSLTDFYVYEGGDTSTLVAYSGLRRFATVLRSVVRRELPVCYVTVNHGEAFTDYEMLYAVADAGYEVKSLDLLYNEIPDDCDLLLTYNPDRDFTVVDGVSGTSELDRLDAYMQKGGRYLVFVSADTFAAGGFANLEGYLADWGVTFAHQTGNTGLEECYLIRDTAHALSTDGYTILTRAGDGEKAAEILAPVLSDAQASVMVSGATAIRPARGFADNGRGQYVKDDGTVTPLLSSYGGAEAWASGRAVDRAGEEGYTLMTLSERPAGDATGYVLACSSTGFACEESMQSAAFDNRGVFMSVIRGMGKTDVPLHIEPQPIADSTIRTMTTAQARAITWVSVLVPSVVLTAVGLWVLLRRKYA